MEYSLFLAQILGPMMVVVGFSLILNKKFFKKIIKDFSKENPIMLYISGLVAMFFGFFILLSIGNIEYPYQYILLFLGYASAIKGIIILLFPKIMKKSAKYFSPFSRFLPYIGLIYILLGVYLCINVY